MLIEKNDFKEYFLKRIGRIFDDEIAPHLKPVEDSKGYLIDWSGQAENMLGDILRGG